MLKRRHFCAQVLASAALPMLPSCAPPSTADAADDELRSRPNLVDDLTHTGRPAPAADPRPRPPVLLPEGAFLFLHGVASGDPTAHSVILWTRVTPDLALEPARELRVEFAVATDPAMTEVIAAGAVITSLEQDYTVHVDLRELEPGTTYYYQFSHPAYAHISSLVGRTRTLPSDPDQLRIAVVACACYSMGYFNSYAAIAAREDVDLVVHVGDYLYEYGTELYFDRNLGRMPDPPHEIITRDDYRLRHAQYRSDPDLQELHRLHPMVCVWDDHELANNWHSSGAANHNPMTEGPFEDRRQNALDAYFQWLPVRAPEPSESQRIYRSFSVGTLLDMVVLDTRSFRDVQTQTQANASERSLLGAAQAAWLEAQLASSAARGAAWRLIITQVLLLPWRLLKARNSDSWDGYGASRQRLLSFLSEHAVPDVLVVSGDWHSSWAGELSRDPFSSDPDDTKALAVEFHCPSVTSPLPSRLREDWADQLKAGPHPHIRFTDFERHGYVLLHVDRQETRAEWHFSRTLREPDATHVLGKCFEVRRGVAQLHEPDVDSPYGPGAISLQK